MLRIKLGPSLLQQCAAAQQWAQQCCWMGAACLSTATVTASAETASVVVKQKKRGSSSKARRSSKDSSKPSIEESSRSSSTDGKPLPPGHQYLHLTFDQLHSNIQQSFALQNPQTEMKLRVLIDKASSPDQVQAAVAAVQQNHMKRSRQLQQQDFGPEVLHELWRAGQRANMGNSFGLQLLEQSHTLGLLTSIRICESVIRSCLKDKDYVAANRAWLYAKAFCSGKVSPSTTRKVKAAAKRQGVELGHAWASKNLMRLYLAGMTEWLKEGGLGLKHQQRLRQEVQQLAEELRVRRANVSWVEQALSESEAKDATTAGASEAADETAQPEEREKAAASGAA